jgi:hypothetical protein
VPAYLIINLIIKFQYPVLLRLSSKLQMPDMQGNQNSFENYDDIIHDAG